jgi:hypothetical protein
VGNLSPLECLEEAVELWKDEIAVAVVLLSRAGKGAQEGNKPGVGRVRGRASGDGVVGTPNPPSSCDSCKRMSTQAQSCWFHAL